MHFFHHLVCLHKHIIYIFLSNLPLHKPNLKIANIFFAPFANYLSFEAKRRPDHYFRTLSLVQNQTDLVVRGTVHRIGHMTVMWLDHVTSAWVIIFQNFKTEEFCFASTPQPIRPHPRTRLRFTQPIVEVQSPGRGSTGSKIAFDWFKQR